MGLEFKIHALNVDEIYPESIPSQNVAKYIAKIDGNNAVETVIALEKKKIINYTFQRS